MTEAADLDRMVELMRSTFEPLVAASANGAEPHTPVDPSAIVFETLREFLDRKLPPAESLVGVTRNGTNLLPRFGWVMPWGKEGSGKTSVLVDLLFHAAAGIKWLDYPIARPLRIVCVVNEGIPGGLQDKLAQKVESWDGDVSTVLDGLALYVSPWGEFSFRDEAIVAHARDYAIDFGADYVALDPLHTLGTTGAGTPQETEEFKHVLRRFGLWEDLGIITAHHSNKLGMVSGDWARHADTVVHLEKDGKNAATKFTLQKARPADPHELGVPALLKWVVESLGFERVAIEAVAKTSDEDLFARIVEALELADGTLTMGDLKAEVKGDDKRIGKLVKDELAKPDGVVMNVATGGGNAFRLALRAPGAADGHRVHRAGEQIGLDTGIPPGETESPGHRVPSSALDDRTRWVTPGPPEGVTPTGYEGRPDEDADDNPFL